uniref:Elongator complex protein 6 n=1 Tax=Eptatretus burgeri TaxID=7764 RepID=A0A8C4R027_EPTBU
MYLLVEKGTDGGFLTHHFITSYIRGGYKVCFLALTQSFGHYCSVAQKLGVSLQAARDRGQLVVFEGLVESLRIMVGTASQHEASPLYFLRNAQKGLMDLYLWVKGAMEPTNDADWKGSVLIVDDLSCFSILSVPLQAILHFVHYLRILLCVQLQGDLVMLVATADDCVDEEEEFLLKSLSHNSTVMVHVEGLSTGACKEVHGQMTVASPRKPSNVQVYQYKLLDKAIQLFPRGTSSAVL